MAVEYFYVYTKSRINIILSITAYVDIIRISGLGNHIEIRKH